MYLVTQWRVYVLQPEGSVTVSTIDHFFVFIVSYFFFYQKRTEQSLNHVHEGKSDHTTMQINSPRLL